LSLYQLWYDDGFEVYGTMATACVLGASMTWRVCTHSWMYCTTLVLHVPWYLRTRKIYLLVIPCRNVIYLEGTPKVRR
jgi:hypothetical protein